MSEVIVKDGQSMIDIAMQEYGSADGVINLIRDNNLVNGYDTRLEAGQVLEIDNEVINRVVKDKLSEIGASPAHQEIIVMGIGNVPLFGGSFGPSFNQSFG